MASIGRGRRWKPERAWARARLELARARVDDVDAALHALAGAEARHDVYRAEHAEELARVDAVESAIETTLRQRVTEVEAFRPLYVIDVLGEPPDDGASRAVWRRATAVIENHRAALGVHDEGGVFGPEPAEGGEVAAWQTAARELEAARAIVSAVRGLDRAQELPGHEPDLGIGMEL